MLISSTFVVLTIFVAPPETTAVQNEYVAALAAAPSTAEGQFRLGTWAKRNRLNEIADGHFRTSAFIDPNFAPAQKALGRTLHSGKWETKSERKSRLELEFAMQSERISWKRRLDEMGLEAAVRGRPITEAAAAGIEEYTGGDRDRSMKAVGVFDDSDSGAATVALIRQAVASRHNDVRKSAGLALCKRNPDYVLPTLLEYARPQRTGKSVVLGVGEIWYWQEGDTLVTALPAAVVREPNIANNASTAIVGANEGAQDEAIGGRHATAERIHANTIAALQSVTGRNIGDDFAAWREAVAEITQINVAAQPGELRSTRTTYYRSDTVNIGTFGASSDAFRSHACFAAGTIVAAKRGDLPIDKVCVGELVLSRNVETGQTAYKPVLARTLRQRVPMNKLTIGDESLIVTPGHPIWSPDSGWVKVKSASKNLGVASEDTTLLVSSNEATEPAQAYNLVVADFGTYFVGKSRVLVHDNSPIREAFPKAR